VRHPSIERHRAGSSGIKRSAWIDSGWREIILKASNLQLGRRPKRQVSCSTCRLGNAIILIPKPSASLNSFSTSSGVKSALAFMPARSRSIPFDPARSRSIPLDLTRCRSSVPSRVGRVIQQYRPTREQLPPLLVRLEQQIGNPKYQGCRTGDGNSDF
jgi:hypothetical protein